LGLLGVIELIHSCLFILVPKELFWRVVRFAMLRKFLWWFIKRLVEKDGQTIWLDGEDG
jgi:hypothetical protein